MHMRHLILLLLLSAVPAAVVGAVYIHAILFIVTPDAVFGLLVISQTLVVALVGGIGTLWGPLIGAAVMVPVSEVLDSTVGESSHTRLGPRAPAARWALRVCTLLTCPCSGRA